MMERGLVASSKHASIVPLSGFIELKTSKRFILDYLLLVNHQMYNIFQARDQRSEVHTVASLVGHTDFHPRPYDKTFPMSRELLLALIWGPSISLDANWSDCALMQEHLFGLRR
jgi:hypothetical protein